MDWDDLKVAMTVAREGSIRSAAEALGVNNATVSRRVRRFEEQLGARLFDRTATGYAITAAGEEVLRSASAMEVEANAIERKLLGQDARLSGDIKFTAPEGLCLKLLMPDLVRFMDRYREVTLDIDISYRTADLTAREADIALRVTGRPPEHLVGRKIAIVAQAPYATPAYLASHNLEEEPANARWLGWSDFVPFPAWVRESSLPDTPVRGRLDSELAQLEAARQGAGISLLPFFIGEHDPNLVRVPGCPLIHRHELWLLSHPDVLQTARIRTLWNYLIEVLEKYDGLLTG
jgi:DNA-binding transcriptional LysR family regulator